MQLGDLRQGEKGRSLGGGGVPYIYIYIYICVWMAEALGARNALLAMGTGEYFFTTRRHTGHKVVASEKALTSAARNHLNL